MKESYPTRLSSSSYPVPEPENNEENRQSKCQLGRGQDDGGIVGIGVTRGFLGHTRRLVQTCFETVEDDFEPEHVLLGEVAAGQQMTDRCDMRVLLARLAEQRLKTCRLSF